MALWSNTASVPIPVLLRLGQDMRICHGSGPPFWTSMGHGIPWAHAAYTITGHVIAMDSSQIGPMRRIEIYAIRS